MPVAAECAIRHGSTLNLVVRDFGCFARTPFEHAAARRKQCGYPRSMESLQGRKSGLSPVVDEDTEILFLDES
jgi:hypothetical protein